MARECRERPGMVKPPPIIWRGVLCLYYTEAMNPRSLRTPIVAAGCILNMAVFLLTLRFSYASYENMGFIIRGGVAGQTAEAAEGIRRRIETFFDERLNDLKILAGRLGEEPDEGRRMERFMRDARLLRRHAFVYHSLLFMDAAGIVRAVSPAGEKPDLVGFDMKALPEIKISHTFILEKRAPSLTRPMVLTTGIPGMVLLYPVFRDPEEKTGFIGILAALMRNDLIVAAGIPDEGSPKYAVEMRGTDQVLYATSALVREDGSPGLEDFIWSTGARRKFPILGRLWEVRVELRNVRGYGAILEANRWRFLGQVALFFLLSVFLCSAIWTLARSQEARRRLFLSEERLDVAIQGSGLGLWDWDLRTGEIIINRRWAEMLGYSLTDLSPSLETWLSMVHPDDKDAVWNRLLRHFQRLEPGFEAEQRLRSKGGEWVWVLSKGRVVERDEEGNPLRAAGTHQDISERKRMEDRLRESIKEKEVLLQEVNHRVKNNLQLLISLLNLQSGEMRDEPALRVMTEWRNRVLAMSLIQEKLHQDGGSEHISSFDYLHSLAEWVFVTHNLVDRIAMDLRIEDLRLGLDQAIPLGLVLNELVSNSLRHAFPDGRRGKVWITLSEPSKTRLRLEVRDDGVGPPPGFDLHGAGSLGLLLVVSLAAQLQGTVEAGPGEGSGFRITLDFPQEKPQRRQEGTRD